MSTTENKLKAYKLLLGEMTDLLIENVDHFKDLAEQHRELFLAATKDQPEVYAAGMEIAAEFAEKGSF